METTHDSVPDSAAPLDSTALTPSVEPANAGAVPTRASLPPKGSCWYCEKPLDCVRRFCGKTCASAFDEEAEYSR